MVGIRPASVNTSSSPPASKRLARDARGTKIAGMPLHPTRRRGETVRGLVLGVFAGAVIWAIVLLLVAWLR
jgi:uncharacterized membrane protein